MLEILILHIVFAWLIFFQAFYFEFFSIHYCVEVSNWRTRMNKILIIFIVLYFNSMAFMLLLFSSSFIWLNEKLARNRLTEFKQINIPLSLHVLTLSNGWLLKWKLSRFYRFWRWRINLNCIDFGNSWF